MPAIPCDYCGADARLIAFGDNGYPYRKDYSPIYVCIPCGAWVGVHKGTTNALGRLANAELRKWKILAHAAFDRLWIAKMKQENCPKGKARGLGYRYLSRHLGTTPDETHIGMFSVEQCRRVVEVCSPEYIRTYMAEKRKAS